MKETVASEHFNFKKDTKIYGELPKPSNLQDESELVERLTRLFIEHALRTFSEP